MKTYTQADFAKWGAKGPKARKRNRKLTKEQARQMVAARIAKKAMARWAKPRSVQP